jgi:hypothetical protein
MNELSSCPCLPLNGNSAKCSPLVSVPDLNPSDPHVFVGVLKVNDENSRFRI